MTARFLTAFGLTVVAACALALPAGALAETAPLPTGADASYGYDVSPVACASAGSCVAVGTYSDSSGNNQGLLLTQAGGVWAAAKAPLPTGAATNPEVSLDAASCPLAGSCLAAGDYHDSGADTQGLMLTEASGAWAASKAPLPLNAATNPQVNLYSTSCAAAGSCVAVGDYYYGSGGYHQGLVVTQTSGGWTDIEAPLPSGADTSFNAGVTSVSCASVGSCVAVGYYFDTDGNRQGLVLTETGGVWAAIKAPLPVGAATVSQLAALDAVSCVSVGSCVAVGRYSDANDYQQEVILTQTGGGWTAAEAPLPAGAAADPSVTLGSLSCPSAGSCVAVGFYDDSSDVQQGVVLTLTANGWAAIKAPLPVGSDISDPTVSLDVVSCASAGSCVATGGYSDSSVHQQGLVLTQSNGTWTAAEAPLPAGANANPDVGLGGVSCAPDGYCALAGAYKGGSGSYQGLLLTSPAADSGASATAGVGQASVSWGAPSDDGGFPVTGYTVTATDLTDAARGGQSVTSDASTLGATLTGLTPGDSYTFSVSATNLLGVGVGTVSNTVTVPIPPPTAAQIAATLKKILAPTGKKAKLRAILENGGYTFSYQALASGRLVIDWYYVTTRETGRKHHRHRVKARTLVAKANVKIAKARTLKVKVKLTKAGRRLLKAQRKLKLTADLSFTPTGGKPIKRTKAFTLR